MKKTVAIVGSHPDTRTWFDFDRTDCDVWLFNEAMNQSWAKRADAVFQMHQPVIWRSSVNRNDPKHYDWLKSGNTPAIVMINQYDDVPMSEKYPLEEIKREFFRNTNIEQYFTSSPAYAIALAIYRGYEHIEIYGVEMETDTEYAYQRTGVALWTGIAIGRGCQVEFHSKKFFNEPLYGYDGAATIQKEHFEQRIAELQPLVQKNDNTFTEKLKAINNILDAFSADYRAGIIGLEEEILSAAQSSYDFGVQDGALQVNERYVKKIEKMLKETGTYVLGRQEYEGAYHGAAGEQPTLNQRYTALGLQLEITVPKLIEATNKDRRAQVVAEVKRIILEYCKAASGMGITAGVGLENTMLMQTHDGVIKAAGGQKSLAVMMDEMAVSA